MTDEQGQHSISNGWTIPALKVYFDQRFVDSEKAVSTALQAAEKAVIKAEVATEKRFNEVRREADDRSSLLAGKIDDLQGAVNRETGGQITSRHMWAIIVPTVVSIVSIVALIFVALHP
jgi:hypothetical protein